MNPEQEEAEIKALIDSDDAAFGKDRGKVADRSCGKRCYATRREAQTIKNLIMNRRTRRRFRPKALRCYHCEECEAWHLATVDQPKPRSMPRVTSWTKEDQRITDDLEKVLDVPYTFSLYCRSGFLEHCECWRCRQERNEDVTATSESLSKQQAEEIDRQHDKKMSDFLRSCKRNKK